MGRKREVHVLDTVVAGPASLLNYAHTNAVDLQSLRSYVETMHALGRVVVVTPSSSYDDDAGLVFASVAGVL